jgi:uncharacterized protein
MRWSSSFCATSSVLPEAERFSMDGSPHNLDTLYRTLVDNIAVYKRVAVGLSGGVDSSLLCKAAVDAVGEGAIAVTICGPMLPGDDLAAAKAVVAATGIRHFMIEEAELEEMIASNPANRCYHCKSTEFSRIASLAGAHGIDTVLDGSNLDDESDYRPGLAALAELKVVSPLRAAGLRKAEIRALAQWLRLPNWDKPAAACLGSRVPYGERITVDKLRAIEMAEAALRSRGFRQCRVRHHGEIARIEVSPAERIRFIDTALMDAVSAAIKAAGFRYVCLDLDGYRTGSLNQGLGQSQVPLS